MASFKVDFKYSMFDIVWFMHNNKPTPGIIDTIKFEWRQDTFGKPENTWTIKRYTVLYDKANRWAKECDESSLFSFKEELINSL